MPDTEVLIDTNAQWNEGVVTKTMVEDNKIHAGIKESFDDAAKASILNGFGTGWVYNIGYAKQGGTSVGYHAPSYPFNIAHLQLLKTSANMRRAGSQGNIWWANDIFGVNHSDVPMETLNYGTRIIYCYYQLTATSPYKDLRLAYLHTDGALRWYDDETPGDKGWKVTLRNLRSSIVETEHYDFHFELKRNGDHLTIKIYDYTDPLVPVLWHTVDIPTTSINGWDSETESYWAIQGSGEAPSAANRYLWDFILSVENYGGTYLSRSFEPPVGEKLLDLALTVENGATNGGISKIEIIKDLDSSIITSTMALISTSRTIYASAFNNGLDGTRDTKFRIKMYFTSGAEDVFAVSKVQGDFIDADPPPPAPGEGQISLRFEDALGVQYLLTKEDSIYYGKVQLGETKKTRVYVRNNDKNRPAENVLITPIEHPYEPLGAAQNTYGATTFSLTESGTFTTTLLLPSIAPDSVREVWIAWAVAEEANPGWAFWAIRARGEYSV